MESKKQAEICLYGTIRTGAGFLASYEGKLYGDGEPHECVSFTAAVRSACAQLTRAGATGTAIVFAPGGGDTAEVDLRHPKPFGQLPWRGFAPVYVVSAEEILKAAAEPMTGVDLVLHESITPAPAGFRWAWVEGEAVLDPIDGEAR